MNKSKRINGSKSSCIAVLDVGSTKVACFIGEIIDDKEAHVIGIGHQVSSGVKNGNIVDMDSVEASIRATVESAELMAGENVSHVSVSLAGIEPKSELISFDVSIAGNQISDSDLKRALDPAWIYSQQSLDREVVHTLPVSYSIDGKKGIKDPRGMHGDKLGVNMHVITTPSSSVRNLETCINRCHLEISELVITPYASSLACLVKDEMELGSLCIDMGGGSTTISVFFDNQMIYADSIPIGGLHVTNDIAKGLSAPLSHSERMKSLYGSAISSPSDDMEQIKIPLVGEDENETTEVPRSLLIGIIKPRLEEIFELVKKKIIDSGFEKVLGRRAVLTGGASQLTGITNLAATILDKQVRLGRPSNIEGLAESANGPGFSVCAGLIQHHLNERQSILSTASNKVGLTESKIARFGQWLRDYV